MRKTRRRNEWRNFDKENGTLEKIYLGSTDERDDGTLHEKKKIIWGGKYIYRKT
jgi:hypothetical protein